VSVTRVGHRQHERPDVGLDETGQNRGERHIEIVGTVVVAAADVRANAICGHIGQGAVDDPDDTVDERKEIGFGVIGEVGVALHGQVGVVPVLHGRRDDSGRW